MPTPPPAAPGAEYEGDHQLPQTHSRCLGQSQLLSRTLRLHDEDGAILAVAEMEPRQKLHELVVTSGATTSSTTSAARPPASPEHGKEGETFLRSADTTATVFDCAGKRHTHLEP
jgi:hypothetical protein